jgi:CRP/FNR family cyclic AMP-dependent transcriptional regulator
MTRALQTNAEPHTVEFWENLGKWDQEIVRSLSRPVTRRKNEPLFPSGQPPEKTFVLLSGRVKMGTVAKDGREVVSSILYKGDLLGETGLWTTGQRGPFAVALDKQVELLEFQAADFRRLLQRLPNVAQYVLRAVGAKLLEAENRSRALLFDPARKRVVDRLKLMVQREGVAIGYELLLRNCPTHQDLADLAGTSRQTVTSILNDLRQQQLLHIDRKNILVRDLDALV